MSWRSRFHNKWPYLSQLYHNASGESYPSDVIDPTLEKCGGRNRDYLVSQEFSEPTQLYGAYKVYVPDEEREKEIKSGESNMEYKKSPETKLSNSSESRSSLASLSPTRIALVLFFVLTILLIITGAIVLTVFLTQEKQITTKYEDYRAQLRVMQVYSVEYKNKESQRYKNTATLFCDEITKVYKESRIRDAFNKCQVIDIRNGSLLIDFLITLSSKSDAPVSQTPEVTQNTAILTDILTESINDNSLGSIPVDKTHTGPFNKVITSDTTPASTTLTTVKSNVIISTRDVPLTTSTPPVTQDSLRTTPNVPSMTTLHTVENLNVTTQGIELTTQGRETLTTNINMNYTSPSGISTSDVTMDTDVTFEIANQTKAYEYTTESMTQRNDTPTTSLPIDKSTGRSQIITEDKGLLNITDSFDPISGSSVTSSQFSVTESTVTVEASTFTTVDKSQSDLGNKTTRAATLTTVRPNTGTVEPQTTMETVTNFTEKSYTSLVEETSHSITNKPMKNNSLPPTHHVEDVTPYIVNATSPRDIDLTTPPRKRVTTSDPTTVVPVGSGGSTNPDEQTEVTVQTTTVEDSYSTMDVITDRKHSNVFNDTTPDSYKSTRSNVYTGVSDSTTHADGVTGVVDKTGYSQSTGNDEIFGESTQQTTTDEYTTNTTDLISKESSTRKL